MDQLRAMAAEREDNADANRDTGPAEPRLGRNTVISGHALHATGRGDPVQQM
ncbi:MAG: hypothetical protein KKB02_03665 [Alphaproteobacteria bacterium]|nr:hypothetical protein [Alphaproteobacteria bacterium]